LGTAAATLLGKTKDVVAAITLIWTLSCGGQSVSAQDNGSLEKAVKATYLYKIGTFVGWPDFAFASPSSDVQLCIVGDDPFGALLDGAVQGQQVDGRTVVIRRMQIAESDSRCHIMFISGSSAQSVEDGLKAMSGTPTLTITDSARDSRAKGIVHFVIRDNRVRFEIDEQVAAASRLTISSKILSIAVSVKART
jgi:hypothetical protein